jgi:CubicO group peptidase (beta-lactamase class C family)
VSAPHLAFLFVLAADAVVKALGASPGAQVLIVDHGRIVYDVPYGVRDVRTRLPVDDRTGFEIGSITKQFTAAAVLQLKERGKVALSDPLGKYLPQYAAARAITLQQLLWQVSGIPDYTSSPDFDDSKPASLDGVLAAIRSRPLDFAPGSQWEYSNTNYYLLGEVVARVSGMPWQQYVRTNIFRPAGMEDSTFSEDEPHVADMATGYSQSGNGSGPIVAAGPMNGWAGAAGDIVSTARDLAKWDAALFGGRVINAGDVKLMTSAGPVPAGPYSGYGFGWMTDAYDGVPRLWHNGGTNGFHSANQVFLSLRQAVIVLSNGNFVDASAVAEAAFDLHNPAIAARANVPAPGENPAITALAKRAWAAISSGPMDRTLFSDSFNAFLTDRRLQDARASLPGGQTASDWIYRGRQAGTRGNVYTYFVDLDGGQRLVVSIAVDAAGKIAGLVYSPR